MTLLICEDNGGFLFGCTGGATWLVPGGGSLLEQL